MKSHVCKNVAPDLINSGQWMHHCHLVRLLGFGHQVWSDHKVTASLSVTTQHCELRCHNKIMTIRFSIMSVNVQTAAQSENYGNETANLEMTDG